MKGKLYNAGTKTWITLGASVIKGAEEALEYAEMRRDHQSVKAEALSNLEVRTEYERLGAVSMNPDNPNFRRANKDFSTIMCFAFRYALGRRSTAPSFVQDYIRGHKNYFETWELEQLIEEVDSEARFHDLGDPNIDEPMWHQFQRDLALEIERRAVNLPYEKGNLNEFDNQTNSAIMKESGVQDDSTTN